MKGTLYHLPGNNFICNSSQKDGNANEVCCTISDDRPPTQIENMLCRQCTYCNHQCDVEDGRTNHSTYPNVILLWYTQNIDYMNIDSISIDNIDIDK